MDSIWKLEVEITGFKAGRVKEIIHACTVEWMFEVEDFDIGPPAPAEPKVLWATGTGTLYNGETKDELMERLIIAVRRANGGPCFMKIEATCQRILEPKFEFLEEPELA